MVLAVVPAVTMDGASSVVVFTETEEKGVDTVPCVRYNT